MKLSSIDTLKDWINDRPTIKRAAAEPAAPTPTPAAQGRNSKERNYIKWKLKGGKKI
jgi:hypothetical protein